MAQDTQPISADERDKGLTGIWKGQPWVEYVLDTPPHTAYRWNGTALIGPSDNPSSYTVASPTGVAATDKASLDAALASGLTVIQLGIGTYQFSAAITGSIAGKTIRGVSRELTILELADGHALDDLFRPSDTYATDTIFEHFTFNGNFQNSATTSNNCGLLKADATAVITNRFKLRNCKLINGRQQCVRLYPASDDVEIEDNVIQNWEDVIFEVTPWSNLKFRRNDCLDYGLNPYYASDTGPVLLIYGGARGAGSYNFSAQGNTFIPVKRTPAVVTMTLASPTVVTHTAHTFRADQKVILDSTGTLLTGFAIGTQYYVSATGLTADTYQLSATQGGASINGSVGQSGVHTVIAGQGQFSIEASGDFIYNATVTGNTFDASNTATSIYAGTGISGSFADSTFDNVFQRGYAGSESTGYEINGPRNQIRGNLHNGKTVIGGGAAAASLVGNVVSIISYVDRASNSGPARNFDHISISGDGVLVDGCELDTVAGVGSGSWAIRVNSGTYSNNIIRNNTLRLGNDTASGINIESTGGSGNTVEDNNLFNVNSGIAVGASSGETFVRNNKQYGSSGAGGGTPLNFNGNTSVVSSGNLPRDGGLQSIAFHATTMSVDARAGSRVTFGTLTANVTAMAAPTNMPPLPERIPFEFYMLQDGTGTRTFVWHSKFVGAFPTGSGTANQKQIVRAVSDGVNFLFVSSTGWYTAT